MREKVLIKGAGEHASGTAHRLLRCGYRVVMTELPCPQAVRRTVSFCSAVFDGRTTVEGVEAVLYRMDEAERLASFDASHVPVFVDPRCEIRTLWKPDVVIDARILKHNLDNRLDDAPLVIGYGPGLVAGKDVHFVIETHRGHDLGRIIAKGAAAPDTRLPGAIEGRTVERVLRAPGDGLFETSKSIGAVLARGDRVGSVDGREVAATLDGILRGLIYPGSQVRTGQKIGDIDPRGTEVDCDTLSDKTRTISGSALEIICAFLGPRTTVGS